ncbi:MAG: PASTA domain-containing protein [Candidatus Marinimicrobia bacterium]|jgi:serine/threonine-protein kinase|nr:PASTA domain-containing protein [Candidatus Neomarinimicrobiota bacterium]MBT3495925.1 PASTA domain-containing protein [Candidatus Neomarinimicrobiota bacterium]MBT3692286.1 PASTA domain-containing protein [Candidatus Neomarinimicrobiota bacterium]MBT3731798.1 PASTA domain-containing protein [Candidatus Neomarinimicrobiota bacterium]MBT4144153.1 PASTA domain-containing protein [Candidatus Neomarinimicrobiota bacterium]
MKTTLIKAGIIFMVISSLFIVLLDNVIMPTYVRLGDGQYLVNVKNKKVNYALQILDSEGFKGVVSDTVFSNFYDEGTVIDQYPRENMIVKQGRTIRLKIAQNARLVIVPSLVGQSLRSAKLALLQSGLVIDTVYTEYNSDYPAGNITWQRPKGGDRLKQGLGVHLMLSEGGAPNFFQVPDLYGLSQKEAKNTLQSAGLQIGEISYQQNEDLIPFTVLEQTIPKGTVLEKKAEIGITVSIIDLNDIFNQVIDK